jgi:3-hydroxyacyl-[acyl-carrier-protein] dehydratase
VSIGVHLWLLNPMNDPLVTALQHLPHGPEFRFIDRLLALDPGRHGVGEYTLRRDEPFLRGHFPGQPLMPGVLLIEAAAQLAGTVAQSDPQIAPMPGLKLTALRGVKILGSVRPGEVIRVEARVTGRLGNLVQASATATVHRQLVLQAELTLSGEV